MPVEKHIKASAKSHLWLSQQLALMRPVLSLLPFVGITFAASGVTTFNDVSLISMMNFCLVSKHLVLGT